MRTTPKLYQTPKPMYNRISQSGRLFQFTEGANLNFSRIPMTIPVLTTMVPGAGPLQSQGYYVSLYLPVKFQGDPPVPLRELNIQEVDYPVGMFTFM